MQRGIPLRGSGRTSRLAAFAAVALALFWGACAGRRREEALHFTPAVQERLDQDYGGLGTRLAELLEIQREKRWDALAPDLLAPSDTRSDPLGFLREYPSWYASKLVDLSVRADQVGRASYGGRTVLIMGCGKYKDCAFPQYFATTLTAVQHGAGWRFYPPSLDVPIDGDPYRCKP